MPTTGRILLRSPNWLGDAIMSLPAYGAWARTWQEESAPEVAVCAPESLEPLWRLVPGVSAFFPADDNPVVTANTITDWNADVALILPNSPRTALESWLAGIPERVGFTGKWRRHLLTRSFQRPRQTGPLHHQSLDTLNLLRDLQWIGPEATCAEVTLPTPAPLNGKSGYFLVCPGAEFGPAKCWIPERYAYVIEDLVGKTGWPVILAGGEGDIEMAQRVETLLPFPVENLAGKTSLSDFLSLIGHAEFILCNDSGSMHAGWVFGRRGVALFGSTEPQMTGPLGRGFAVVREDVPCSPCFLRECPIDFRCMNRLGVDRVLNTCHTLLNL